MVVTVLGPQRRPTVDAVVRDLHPGQPLATVTAGWQEREPEDGELRALLGGRSVNLALHARWLDVQERDRELAVAEREHVAVLDELRSLYLVQLDAALRAVYALAARTAERPRTRAAAVGDAEAVVHLVDERHLRRVRDAAGSFAAAWPVEERPVVAEHRDAVRRVLQDAAGLVVAGGHVGVLLRVLDLVGVAEAIPPTVVAWSAGAMALTERVVLFHDRVPQGPSHAELHADGLGLIPGAVLLPHARRRLQVEDAARMGVLARRFAPAACVVLDDGVRVQLGADGGLPPGVRVIGADGRIVARASEGAA